MVKIYRIPPPPIKDPGYANGHIFARIILLCACIWRHVLPWCLELSSWYGTCIKNFGTGRGDFPVSGLEFPVALLSTEWHIVAVSVHFHVAMSPFWRGCFDHTP